MPVDYRPSLGTQWVTAAGIPAYRIGASRRGIMPPPRPTGGQDLDATMPLTGSRVGGSAVAVRFSPRP